MGRAHSEDLAWRVVFRYHWQGQSYADICDEVTGLNVSYHFVRDVLARYEDTGSVETHQGRGAHHHNRRVLTQKEDMHIIKLMIDTPSALLKDQRAQFILESGVVVSYSAFCGAVARLGFTRKKVRSVHKP